MSVISSIIKVEVRGYQAKPKTLTVILDIPKTESNNFFYYTSNEKNVSHVFASSLTASNTKRANLT